MLLKKVHIVIIKASGKKKNLLNCNKVASVIEFFLKFHYVQTSVSHFWKTLFSTASSNHFGSIYRELISLVSLVIVLSDNVELCLQKS